MNDLDFASYFEEIHGVPPLPWQSRLAAILASENQWPDVIDLPTASGKTACLDIALFHLALCAQRGEPWKAARRIAFVVDRRIIVDAAADRAQRMQDALDNPRGPSVRAVAEALGKLGGTKPLLCQKLRGGMPKEPAFTSNPAQPLIITSTVDQIGSRLLFRGYGLRDYAAPVHAGLLGHDTLILLDEAHLSEPFLAMIEAVRREQARAEKPIDRLQPVRIVAMSATARAAGTPFRLDAADLAHPSLRERRTAAKPARLIEAPTRTNRRLRSLHEQTLALLSEIEHPAPAIAVVVNRVATARAIYGLLKDELEERNVDSILLIGRSRPLDRDHLARLLVARTGAGRASVENDRGVVVVATQTIEVGADLDFQGMVTECASIDALRQRFGRLDRLGHFRNSRAVIVGGGEDEDDPVYGPALSRTWRWLNEIARREGEYPVVDFSIESMESALESANVLDMSAVPRPILPLTPSFVQLLCQTAPRPAIEPDVAALLHGIDTAAPDVQIVWRADIPVLGEGGTAVLDRRADAAATRLLELNPPSSLEAISLPLRTVRAWLEGERDDSTVADLEGTAAVEGDDGGSPNGAPRQVWRRGPRGWEAIFARDLRPGDTIVVPSAYGGCDKYGYAPDSNALVEDLSAQARAALQRSPLLILTARTLASGAHLDEDEAARLWTRLRDGYSEGVAPEQMLQLVLDSIAQPVREQWRRVLENPVIDVLASTSRGEDDFLYAIAVMPARPEPGDLSDEDLSSSRTVPITLAAHSGGVGEKARSLALSAGLAPEVVDTVSKAGLLHDLGKADPRFQTLLRAGDAETAAGQLLAKGLRRSARSRLGQVERHEAYSVALIRAHTELLERTQDPELALYLVGTHHGRGRALMPFENDEGTAFDVEVENKIYSFDGAPKLGTAGSQWAALFWQLTRRYGPWGLAYLEAVVRLADQFRSREELEGKGVAA